MNDYTALPNQLFRDLREGKINNTMFDILAWLYMRADYATGIVKKVSSKRIQAEMWGDEYDEAPSLRTIQKWLKVLETCNYIKSGHVQGTRRSYVVVLTNYCTAKRDENGKIVLDADGDAEEIVLRPTQTGDYRDLPPSSCGDEDAEPSGDRAVSVRRACGEPSAYTLIDHHPTPASALPSSPFHQGSSSGGSHGAAPELESREGDRTVPVESQTPDLVSDPDSEDEVWNPALSLSPKVLKSPLSQNGGEAAPTPTRAVPSPNQASKLAQEFWIGIGSPAKYESLTATKWRDLIHAKVQLHSPDYVAGLIAWALESEFWYPRIKNSRALDPMEFFLSKFETLEDQRETDEEMARRNKKKRPASNIASGSAAAEGAPEYRKEKIGWE